MKKVFGIVMIVVGVTGLLFSIAGIVVGFAVVDQAVQGVLSGLELTQKSLGTVVESLELTKTTVAQANDGIATVEDTANNVSITLEDTRPLLDQIAQVASVDVPNSLDALQNTMPNLVEVASVIDTTLTKLSEFKIDQNLGLFSLSFDLGIEYDPAEPFNESVDALGHSLDGVPEQLRSLETQVAVSSDNLANISTNVADLADDINAINSSIAEIIPLLDQYIEIVQEIDTNLQNVAASVEAQGNNVKIAIIVISVWFALYQTLPVYVGWSAIKGNKDPEQQEAKDKDMKQSESDEPAQENEQEQESAPDQESEEAEQ